jgi:hypothetical protein
MLVTSCAGFVAFANLRRVTLPGYCPNGHRPNVHLLHCMQEVPQAPVFQCFALIQINRQLLMGRNVALFEEMSHG